MSTAATRPRTISQFVLKVHSRCNLACDHCYVYEYGDETWRRQPPMMSPATVRATASRIAEHVRAHELDQVTLVLHGGEPLLVGADALTSMLEVFQSTLAPLTRLALRAQSNGLPLTAKVAGILSDFDVRVGISLDGGQAANDRHRRMHNGRSSYQGVRRALELLRRPEFHRIFGGILCTVDVRNDPVEVYEALVAERAPRLDLLLPHANWDRPPLRPSGDPAAYGQWLARLYRRWLADGRPVPIRLFDSMRSAMAGGPSGSEWVGLDPVDVAVVETDGSWEQVDSLKTSFDAAAATGLTVFQNPVDDVANHPSIARRWLGLSALSAECQACPSVRVCGGGLFAHRYRADNGYDNPTVYCADVKELVAVMQEHPPRNGPTNQVIGPDDTVLAVLDDLGGGYAEPETIAMLRRSQLRINRTLLGEVVERFADNRQVAAGWSRLVELDREHPASAAAVIRHPYLRVWATRCLKRTGPVADPGYLANIAAAAATRAGVAAELELTVHDGWSVLPTVGATRGSRALSRNLIDRWRPASYVTVDSRPIHLEDQDPHRDCHQWYAHDRLSLTEVNQWNQALHRAWLRVQEERPEHVAGLIAGVDTITPLTPHPDGNGRSETARHAFGAVGLALADEATLALLLVHELQHVKLGALLDLVNLYDREYRPRIAVPWRADERPVEGALQGTYAHLAVADIWRARAEEDAATGVLAAQRYQTYRDWTERGIAALRETGALTAAGERFVDRMDQTLAGWK